jgi:GH25 family lysozyme M1 (1,4-beta-N-acetylmuramidase)/putative cell wall-binding protein
MGSSRGAEVSGRVASGTAQSQGPLSATPNAASPDASTASPPSNLIKGVDVSGYQTDKTDWANLQNEGYKFAFIKSTESTTYISSYFQKQWVAAGAQGFIRGTYHFAQPAESSGATQARYFYAHGAAMSAGTLGTLPPALDIENSDCAGLTPAAMVSWISSFVSTITSLTGRQPLIYTYQGWWNKCTGGSTAFNTRVHFWEAYWVAGATEPWLPAGWNGWTYWQYSDDLASNGSAAGGDIDVFNSTSLAALQADAGYDRIAGPDRFATGVEASEPFGTGGTVFIAGGKDFPDALSASAAAGKSGGPVLLAEGNSVTPMVGARLRVLKPSKIALVGGTTALPSALQKSLATYTASGSANDVLREYGANRYATSAAVATANFDTGVAHLYIASGATWPDALAGSAVAAGTSAGGPMLLVEPGQIPTVIASALNALRPAQITVLGGAQAVSDAVVAQLRAYTSGAVTRIAGADRYATAQQLAVKNFPSGLPVVYVASGASFPDALVGGPLAGHTAATVLMTAATSIPAGTSTALASLKPKRIVILGGTASVSASVQAALERYVVN